jgi:hypothetical protein
LLTAPALSFANYDAFGIKIASFGNRELIEYHETTKYRLEIAEYCLKLLLGNYNNGIAFAAGLTGFLVQGKACLDSLCQELNLHCRLKLSKPSFAIDTEILLDKLHLLGAKNRALMDFLGGEFGGKNEGASWFKEFKELRDWEGVHQSRIPRLLKVGKPHHDIIIHGKQEAEYCVGIISRINTIIEQSYGLM